MKSKSLISIISPIVVGVAIFLIMVSNVIDGNKTNLMNTSYYNGPNATSGNGFFTEHIDMSIHSLVYDDLNSTTNLPNSTITPSAVIINFHNVKFTFNHVCCAPIPLNAPIGMSLKFSDGINETLSVTDPKSTNQTIVVLSKHINPQAGVSLAKNTLDLLVSKD